MIPCTDHGPSAWCYIQDDQSHVDSEHCHCLWTGRADCAVDAHRGQAGQPV